MWFHRGSRILSTFESLLSNSAKPHVFRNVDMAKDGDSQLEGTRDNEEILQTVEDKRFRIAMIRSQ